MISRIEYVIGGRFPGLRLTGLALWICLAASWLAAQDLGAKIELIPSPPTVNDIVAFRLSGTWRDGCVPQLPVVSAAGNSIRIDTTNLSIACTQAITAWSLSGSVGKLAAGQYRLAVYYSGPSSPSTISLGGIDFAVAEAAPINERILPIVVNGSAAGLPVHYQTAFALVNGSSQSVRASLQVYAGSGSAGSVFDTKVASSSSEVEPTLNPGGRFHQFTAASLPFFDGWARLTWDGPDLLLGSAEVTMVEGKPDPSSPAYTAPSTAILSTTQLPAVRAAQEFRFSVALNASRQTAVALVNPSETQSVKVKIAILDENGDSALMGLPGSFEITLQPMQRISDFLWHLLAQQFPSLLPVPMPKDFQGSAMITADGPVGASALDILLPEGKFVAIAEYGQQ